MLPQEENELLCRTGPGTPMGALFRRYWLPVVMSRDLETDGPPLRTRMLCEDLVAFRDTEGRAGLLEDLCPHRLAPLYIGRNEESGLRCLYHGWKFDVAGVCVDMPNEPADSNFKSKVRARAFPTHEHAGVVWAYFGDPEKVPEFPVYRWTLVPESHRIMARWIQEANWMQSLEGGIDTSHASFLHRTFDQMAQVSDQETLRTGARRDMMWRDKAPRLELQPTNYGFRYAAIRTPEEGKLYVRITPHVMPCSSYPPGFRGENRIWNCWVPRDDESSWAWDVSYHETRPLNPTEVAGLREVRGYNSYDPATFRKYGNRENLWLQDRKAMQTVSWSGIRGIFPQDNAVQEGMGTIVDRSREHLGTADLAIIAARRLYLQAAQALAEHGTEPPGVLSAETYQDIDSFAYVQDAGRPWHEVQPLEEQFRVEQA
jgi:phthalate 4,5-dioxygenase